MGPIGAQVVFPPPTVWRMCVRNQPTWLQKVSKLVLIPPMCQKIENFWLVQIGAQTRYFHKPTSHEHHDSMIGYRPLQAFRLKKIIENCRNAQKIFFLGCLCNSFAEVPKIIHFFFHKPNLKFGRKLAPLPYVCESQH